MEREERERLRTLAATATLTALDYLDLALDAERRGLCLDDAARDVWASFGGSIVEHTVGLATSAPYLTVERVVGPAPRHPRSLPRVQYVTRDGLGRPIRYDRADWSGRVIDGDGKMTDEVTRWTAS